MSRFTCDPALTGNLNAEYEALQNDLEQAKLLAADYQSQLSDKTNDYATLKFTLEKTVGDLEKLQEHIIALRTERHNLANEVMKVVSLEAKLANSEAKVASLKDDLRREREALKSEREALKSEREALKREREGKRGSGGASGVVSAGAGRREQIAVEYDGDKSMEIIPSTPASPRPFKSFPPRG